MELYTYRCYTPDEPSWVYDGDTIKADIHLGFGVVLRKQTFRLYGINAWEMRGENKEKGTAARDYVRSHILGRNYMIKSHMEVGRNGKGKYGRWLAEVYAGGLNINERLVKLGHAVPAEY